MEPFTQSPFESYSRLGRMKWKDEQVDVFTNGICRLAGLARFAGECLEQVIKLTFVNGFPDHVSEALQQIENIESVSVDTLIARARILTRARGGEIETGAS